MDDFEAGGGEQEMMTCAYHLSQSECLHQAWLKRPYTFYHQCLACDNSWPCAWQGPMALHDPLRFSGFYQDEYSRNLRAQATARLKKLLEVRAKGHLPFRL